jgi:hypothetical protein
MAAQTDTEHERKVIIQFVGFPHSNQQTTTETFFLGPGNHEREQLLLNPHCNRETTQARKRGGISRTGSRLEAQMVFVLN